MKSPQAIRSARWRSKHLAKSLELGRAAYWAKRDENVAKKRAYNAARREEINTKSRAYEAANRDKKLARMAAYREANREELRRKSREYTRLNKAAALERTRRRQLVAARAMPLWVSQKELKDIYERCAGITKATGMTHNVDHIVPLRNAKVCGLHVPWNLQILTKAENLRKANKFTVAA